MTAGTSDQRTRAAQQAFERHGERRTRGPMAEMMRDAGFSADRIRASGAAFTSIHGDMTPIIGSAATDRFIAEFAAVADAMDA